MSKRRRSLSRSKMPVLSGCSMLPELSDIPPCLACTCMPGHDSDPVLPHVCLPCHVPVSIIASSSSEARIPVSINTLHRLSNCTCYRSRCADISWRGEAPAGGIASVAIGWASACRLSTGGPGRCRECLDVSRCMHTPAPHTDVIA